MGKRQNKLPQAKEPTGKRPFISVRNYEKACYTMLMILIWHHNHAPLPASASRHRLYSSFCQKTRFISVRTASVHSCQKNRECFISSFCRRSTFDRPSFRPAFLIAPAARV